MRAIGAIPTTDIRVTAGDDEWLIGFTPGHRYEHRTASEFHSYADGDGDPHDYLISEFTNVLDLGRLIISMLANGGPASIAVGGATYRLEAVLSLPADDEAISLIETDVEAAVVRIACGAEGYAIGDELCRLIRRHAFADAR